MKRMNLLRKKTINLVCLCYKVFVFVFVFVCKYLFVSICFVSCVLWIYEDVQWLWKIFWFKSFDKSSVNPHWWFICGD